MGKPRSKKVSSDIASDVEDSKSNEKIAFITFSMVVQHMLMGAQHMLLVAHHMLRVVQLSQLPTKLKLKLKLKLSLAKLSCTCFYCSKD